MVFCREGMLGKAAFGWRWLRPLQPRQMWKLGLKEAIHRSQWLCPNANWRLRMIWLREMRLREKHITINKAAFWTYVCTHKPGEQRIYTIASKPSYTTIAFSLTLFMLNEKTSLKMSANMRICNFFRNKEKKRGRNFCLKNTLGFKNRWETDSVHVPPIREWETEQRSSTELR